MINKEQVQGKAQQLKGSIKSTWAKLTDDEVAYYEGQQDKFFGAVKEKYGVAKEEAEKKMKELESNCGCDSSSNRAA